MWRGEQGFAPLPCHRPTLSRLGGERWLATMPMVWPIWAQGVGSWAGGGYGLATPWFQVRHAEALIVADQPEEALAVIDEALNAIETGPQHQFRANALVARGDARALLGDKEAAEHDYVAAYDSAAAQHGAGEELHALVHRARLLGAAGQDSDVLDRLTAVLDRIGDEAHPEIIEARELLASATA